MPGLPLLAFTRRSACLQFSRSQTSSIHCSLVGLSALCFANSDSVPPSKAIGAAPLLSSGKARQYWLFCRLSVVESRRVLIAPFMPLMDRGFAAICQLARTLPASHPVFVHRLASLLHASFRPHLAVRPLRFAITSPPSGCEEDLHLPAVGHARHTKEKRCGESPQREKKRYPKT